MKLKHSKGPWSINAELDSDNNLDCSIYSADNTNLGLISIDNDQMMTLATAKLVSYAPFMLETLQLASRMLSQEKIDRLALSDVINQTIRAVELEIDL